MGLLDRPAAFGCALSALAAHGLDTVDYERPHVTGVSRATQIGYALLVSRAVSARAAGLAGCTWHADVTECTCQEPVVERQLAIRHHSFSVLSADGNGVRESFPQIHPNVANASGDRWWPLRHMCVCACWLYLAC